MTVEELKAKFDEYDDEFLKFERIGEGTPSLRLDLCAFLLLDKLVPDKFDIVADAAHEQIYLETNVEELASRATEQDVLYLRRCGVWFDEETDSLSMFV